VELYCNIDAIANKAIDSKMTPGIQVLVAKRKSYFQKSYGFTYDKAIKVKDSDIYDLASLTKIATLPNVMLQYDQQKINLETTLGTMSPIFKDSNKANINLKICFLITLDWRLEYRFIKPQWTIRNFLRKFF
jgi:CubicO group peptidase (beta-lactamase class C family)